jgi:hypothetical protein
MKELRDKERKFDIGSNRIQAVDFKNNGVDFTSAWTFAGAKIGYNTSEKGELFVRIADETPGAGQAQVSLYRATGAAAAISSRRARALTERRSRSPSRTRRASPPRSRSRPSRRARRTTSTFSSSSRTGSSGRRRSSTTRSRSTARSRTLYDEACQGNAGLGDPGRNLRLGGRARSRSSRRASPTSWARARARTRSVKKAQRALDGAVHRRQYRASSRTAAPTWSTRRPPARRRSCRTSSRRARSGLRRGTTRAAGPWRRRPWRSGPPTDRSRSSVEDDTLGAESFSGHAAPHATSATRSRRTTGSWIKQRFADPVLGIVSMHAPPFHHEARRAAPRTWRTARSLGGRAARTPGTPTPASSTSRSRRVGRRLRSSRRSRSAPGRWSHVLLQLQGRHGARRRPRRHGERRERRHAAQQRRDLLGRLRRERRGTGKLQIALKRTVDGEWGRIERGGGSNFQDQGGAGQDTFNDGETIGNFRLDGYSSSLLTPATQVFTTTAGAASASIVVSPINSSGLTGTGVLGTNPTPGNTATLDLQVFSAENSHNVPDKITIAVSAPNSGARRVPGSPRRDLRLWAQPRSLGHGDPQRGLRHGGHVPALLGA